MTNAGEPGAGTLTRPDGATIAYHRLEGKSPGVVFLHGYHSDMTGTKALALEALCRAQGRAFLRFDYFAHGQSTGDDAERTISRWAEDAVAVLDTLTEGPQVLVGSSLGGWIALKTALARPERIAALVGVAAAPDFTEELIWDAFTPEQKAAMDANGFVHLDNCYEPESPWRVDRRLIEDGRHNLLLKGPIRLDCPVRLIQGQKDADVPWETAVRIAEKLTGTDVEITLVKDGDHRLSRDQDLARLTGVVETLLAALG